MARRWVRSNAPPYEQLVVVGQYGMPSTCPTTTHAAPLSKVAWDGTELDTELTPAPSAVTYMVWEGRFSVPALPQGYIQDRDAVRVSTA